MRKLLVAVAAVALSACGGHRFDEDAGAACGCDVANAAGTVSLTARSSCADQDAGYLLATYSFQHATADVAIAGNDWDVLYGNDQDPAADFFTVNTVVDDESYIVDLGEIAFRDVPATIDPANIRNDRRDPDATGVSKYDEVKVVEGHVYYVRTKDADTRQVAVFGVKHHVLNQSVEIAWFRSSAADSFVFAWP